MSRRKIPTRRSCAICRSPFIAEHGLLDKYCSETCRQEAHRVAAQKYRRRIKPARKQGEMSARILFCAACGVQFTSTHSQARYCSGECRGEIGAGYKRAYNIRHPVRVKEQRKDYYRRNRDKKREKNRAYRSSPSGKIATKASYERSRIKFPERIFARHVVRAAILAGYITPLPCERCGGKTKTHAHHRDYSRPLDVEWLCIPCHADEHSHNRAIKWT
jgi:hypothetical protein